MKIELATADRRRRGQDEPDIVMRNRYVEPNPTLSDGDMALSARPGLKYWQTIGTGPLRGLFQQAGAFKGDFFTMSGDSLYRVGQDGVPVFIQNNFAGGASGLPVKMACTGDVGTTPPFLYIADGTTLRVYTDQGFASGQLQCSSVTPADGDVVHIDNTYYKFTAAGVDAGTPNGTLATPWLVKTAATKVQAFDNLKAAINASGTLGVTYSSGITLRQNTFTAYQNISTGLFVQATLPGGLGNAIVTQVTAADLSWGGATLAGGGVPTCTPVAMPNDVAVLDVCFVKGFIIIVPVQGAGINGRFYWIIPGAIVVDPLNYATAERKPDAVTQVVAFNDEFWLCGQTTTEPWYATPDPNAPMQPIQGVSIDRGVLGGSAVQIKETMIMVDQEGGVFSVQGGQKRISPPDIEERIRAAILYQNARVLTA